MEIGIIGEGAIGAYVHEQLVKQGRSARAILLLPEFLRGRDLQDGKTKFVSSVDDLPDEIDHMVDCAGHIALKSHGPSILRRGIDLTTVSIGALADEDLYQQLSDAANEANSKLHLVSGAIGALDALRAASVGGLDSVTYVGRKPPKGWKGSPADDSLDLDNLGNREATHFEGTAREAAVRYPKNANVAAAVALAGVGFDKTRVKLVADPNTKTNVHEIQAVGAFGQFSFEIQGKALPDNPRSSALAAMSVISKLEQESQPICF